MNMKCQLKALTRYQIAIGSWEYYFTIVAFGLPIILDYLYIMLQSLNMIHFHFTQSLRAHRLLQIWISIPMVTAFAQCVKQPLMWSTLLVLHPIKKFTMFSK
jgi:hypothetical protein